MSDLTLKKWYLVYTKPRQESVARTNLARQGYEIYLPLICQPRKRKGRREMAIAPMFPRYLFIHLDSRTDDWGPIRSTLGVVSIVRFGHVPAKVPDDFVAMLKAREGENGVQMVPVKEYRRDDKIRIADGPLAGYEGIFLTKTSQERVVVLLDILGKFTRTVVETATVEPG